MTSLFRPLLLSLLCLVIAFGQLPALLHVASCDGHAHCQKVHSSSGLQVCSHGCNHHELENEESPSVPLHDSEDCVICHSLANPVGLVGNFEFPLVQEYLFELASNCADRLLVEASIAIAQPRGPPVIA